MRTISPRAARCLHAVRWTVARCQPHVRAARTIQCLLRCELRQAVQQRLVSCAVAQRKRHVCKSLLRILHVGQCVRCQSRVVCRMLHSPSGTTLVQSMKRSCKFPMRLVQDPMQCTGRAALSPIPSYPPALLSCSCCTPRPCRALDRTTLCRAPAAMRPPRVPPLGPCAALCAALQ